MSFGSASATRWAYAEESSWGTNPGSGFVQARFTSDSILSDVKTEQSKEIRNDRNNTDLIRTDVTATGDLNFEFSAKNFDTFIEGAMCSDWQTLVDLSGKHIDISASTGQTATLTDAATSGAFTDVSVGDWIKIGGFTAAADNGYVHVTGKTSANVIAVEGLTFVNEAGQTDITIKGSRIRVGVSKKSYTMERQWTDIANVYDLFVGMRVANWSMKINPGAIVTGKFGFLGKRQDSFATSQVGSVTSPGTEDVVNAIDNISLIRVGDISTDSIYTWTELSFELNNNLRAQTAIGTLGAKDVALGTAVVTGTLVAYLEDRNLMLDFQNFDEASISFLVADADGNSYMFTFPRIKYSKGDNQVRGQNTDGLVTLNWSNLVDANGIAFEVTRFQS